MLRSVPGALHVGAPPTFRSPVDVAVWAWSTAWVIHGDRAVILHLDEDNRLACVASAPGRLSTVGPFSRDVVGTQTLECGTAVAIAVDVRRSLAGREPTETDRRRHRTLHSLLATYGVVLLDTVIVWPTDFASVTGELEPRAPTSGLRVHIPERPCLPPDDDGWSHDLSGRRRLSLWPLEDGPA